MISPVHLGRYRSPERFSFGSLFAGLLAVAAGAGCSDHSRCDDASWAAFTTESIPWVIGHRGTTNIAAPENTMPAFRFAADAQAGIEVDVRTTADGGHVLIHDETAARTTGKQLVIAEATLRDVTALDASYAFHPDVFHGANVPALTEFLDTFGSTSPVLVHAISGDVAPVVQAIRDRRLGPSVVLQSWSRLQLSASMRAGACIRTQILSDSDDVKQYLDAPDLWSVGMRSDRITPEAVRLLADAGKWVMAWTVNDVWAAERLVQIGVAGIITDDPGYMRRLLLGVTPTGSSVNVPVDFLGSGWRFYASSGSSPELAGAFATFGVATSTTPTTYLIYPGIRTPEGSYTITTTLVLMNASMDSTAPIGLRFGWGADSDVSTLGRPEPGARDGYNFLYRANGAVEIQSVTENVPTAIAMGAWGAVAEGGAVPLRVSVTPSAITIEQTDSGESISAVDVAHSRHGFISAFGVGQVPGLGDTTLSY